MSSLLHDVRYALRGLVRKPAFTAVAVLTLALGIGANAAIFSVVETALLRPLTYRDPERLYVIHEVLPNVVSGLAPVNALHFREWQTTTRWFEQLALVYSISLKLTGTGEPERLPVGRVSPSLFPMLGIRPQLGRTFADDEDQPGRDRVVVLNHELWRRRFDADPQIVGRTIALDGEPYEVVGVLPAAFHFPKLSHLYGMAIPAAERPQIWKPFAARDEELRLLGSFNFVSIGRLKPDVAPSQALAELNAVQANLARQAPDSVDLRAALVPLQDQITGRSRNGLQLMLAAVGMVLLIGCINITNLLLVRAAHRQREVAIRTALGASRGRLVQQALLESLILSGIGSAVGLWIATAAVRLIVASAPVDLPRVDEVVVNLRVIVFTAGASVLTGLLIGVLPAWRFVQSEPLEAIRSVSRTATVSRVSARLRSTLVAFEVGVSVMCLIAAGLLLHSFVKLLNVDRGFDVQRIVTVDVNLPISRYPDVEQRAMFARTLLDRVGSLPGVTSAAVSNLLPASGEVSNSSVAVEGTTLPRMERPVAGVQLVSPDYFRTMGVPLRAGRIFGDSDRDRRRVAVVSAFTAERLWSGMNPLGKRFRRGPDNSPPIEVIGVVGDVRRVSLNESPSPHIYEPYWQFLPGRMSLAVRATSEPVTVFAVIRAAIRESDPELPVPAFHTMEDVVDESVAGRRFQMNLVLMFAVAAVLLASLGIYGVVSYSVAQRTNEMGIRIALGAQPDSIRLMVLRQGLLPVVVGLAAGVFASIALGRILRGLLFGVTPTDVTTFVAVSVLVGVVALVSIFIPARRATRVNPIVALRYE